MTPDGRVRGAAHLAPSGNRRTSSARTTKPHSAPPRPDLRRASRADKNSLEDYTPLRPISDWQVNPVSRVTASPTGPRIPSKISLDRINRHATGAFSKSQPSGNQGIRAEYLPVRVACFPVGRGKARPHRHASAGPGPSFRGVGNLLFMSGSIAPEHGPFLAVGAGLYQQPAAPQPTTR